MFAELRKLLRSGAICRHQLWGKRSCVSCLHERAWLIDPGILLHPLIILYHKKKGLSLKTRAQSRFSIFLILDCKALRFVLCAPSAVEYLFYTLLHPAFPTQSQSNACGKNPG